MTVPTTTERIQAVRDAESAVIRAARGVTRCHPRAVKVAEWHMLVDALDNLDASLDALRGGEGAKP